MRVLCINRAFFSESINTKRETLLLLTGRAQHHTAVISVTYVSRLCNIQLPLSLDGRLFHFSFCFVEFVHETHKQYFSMTDILQVRF